MIHPDLVWIGGHEVFEVISLDRGNIECRVLVAVDDKLMKGGDLVRPLQPETGPGLSFKFVSQFVVEIVPDGFEWLFQVDGVGVPDSRVTLAPEVMTYIVELRDECYRDVVRRKFLDHPPNFFSDHPQRRFLLTLLEPLEVPAHHAPEVGYHGERGRGEDSADDAIHPPVEERKRTDHLVSFIDRIREERAPGMSCRQVQVVPLMKEESRWTLVDEGIPGIFVINPAHGHSVTRSAVCDL